ncbi:MAG: Transcriptional regulatory protein KdpE [Alphaproteobacteria bacterium MarineAlpha2_Bin1]|nr:MAG: Transcriptional regulatory protein KdpE [Alphaproteobacteria bacterium MarineAlpha2_Bin1]|tara:strand:- start:927 stop:1619 length:693 start_codon:yes stop_codon:yes gene_type:complete
MSNQKNILLYLDDKDLQKEIYILLNQTNIFSPVIFEEGHLKNKYLDIEKFECLICDSKFINLLDYLDKDILIKHENDILVYIISKYQIDLSNDLYSSFIFFHTKLPIQFRDFVISIEKNLLILNNKKNKKVFIGDLIFYPYLKKIVNQNNIEKIIKLTDKENAIIEYLSKEENILVSKDVLLKEVWGYNDLVDTHTLETHIYKIRRKIEKDHKKPKYLMNEEGGYRLKFH